MSNDKRTIGVTAGNDRVLTDLVAAGHFTGLNSRQQNSLWRFAVSRQTPIGSAEGTSTKWNVGTVDSDGVLKSVVEALYPTRQSLIDWSNI